MANAARSSNHDATRTVMIRTLARANETANTYMIRGINRLRIRRSFPFVRPSLFPWSFDSPVIMTLWTSNTGAVGRC